MAPVRTSSGSRARGTSSTWTSSPASGRGACHPLAVQGQKGVVPVALQRRVGMRHAEQPPPPAAESRLLLQLAARGLLGGLAGVHDAPGDLQRLGVDPRAVLPHHHRLPRGGEGDDV